MTQAASGPQGAHPAQPLADRAGARAWVAQQQDCLGWSVRAWAEVWSVFAQAHAGQRWADALEIGAGSKSSLAPLMLGLAERVDCSVYDPAALPATQALNAQALSPELLARVHYSQRDVRALQGRWDLIVLKSVLGGVHRLGQSTLADVAGTVQRLVDEHLNPGGALVSLDNGRTVLEPLLAGLGARRNGWRFFAANELPQADERTSFGVLSIASAASRLGRPGRWVDDALYQADRVLSPLARQHAVHLSVWRRPA